MGTVIPPLPPTINPDAWYHIKWWMGSEEPLCDTSSGGFSTCVIGSELEPDEGVCYGDIRLWHIWLIVGGPFETQEECIASI